MGLQERPPHRATETGLRDNLDTRPLEAVQHGINTVLSHILSRTDRPAVRARRTTALEMVDDCRRDVSRLQDSITLAQALRETTMFSKPSRPNTPKKKKRVHFDTEAMAKPEDGPERRIEAVVERVHTQDRTLEAVDVATTADSLGIDETSSVEKSSEASEIGQDPGFGRSTMHEVSEFETYGPEDEPQHRDARAAHWEDRNTQQKSQAKKDEDHATRKGIHRGNHIIGVVPPGPDPKPSCRCGSFCRPKPPEGLYWINDAALERLTGADGKNREDDMKEVNEREFRRWARNLKQAPKKRRGCGGKKKQTPRRQSPPPRPRRGMLARFMSKF